MVADDEQGLPEIKAAVRSRRSFLNKLTSPVMLVAAFTVTMSFTWVPRLITLTVVLGGALASATTSAFSTAAVVAEVCGAGYRPGV